MTKKLYIELLEAEVYKLREEIHRLEQDKIHREMEEVASLLDAMKLKVKENGTVENGEITKDEQS